MKTIFLLLASIISLALLAQMDDDLTTDARRLMSKVEIAHESDSYLYLIGTYANESDTPEEVGKALLGEYRKLEANGSAAS